MRERHQDIERRLARAVERRTPEVLEQVRQRLEDPRENISVIEPVQQRRGNATLRLLAGIAAMLLLVFGLDQGINYIIPVASISFDVNPSVELRVNRAERVLSAKARSAEAEVILGEMRLRNVDLNVAVNALIGSMVKHGYLSEIRNSILITVDGSEQNSAQQLQQRLTDEVDRMLSAYAVQGAVLSQTLTEDERLQQLADRYGITPGKAALVDQLVTQDATLDFAGVAALPINDINLLIEARQPALEGVDSRGQAGSGGYIGQQRALDIALAHAGVAAEAVAKLEIELDYDHGRMVYELEFEAQGAEYELEIDAAEGTVLFYERDGDDRGEQQVSTPPGSAHDGDRAEPPAHDRHGQEHGGPSGDIGEERAKSAALAHAGLSAAQLDKYKSELDYEDDWGRWIYQIEFKSGGIEYECEIDARTGEVLYWEIDD